MVNSTMSVSYSRVPLDWLEDGGIDISVFGGSLGRMEKIEFFPVE